jgi:molybdenum cofactor guanylyltransferase
MTNTIPAHDITGLILSGGQGARMGYVEKGLQHLHGKPLVKHVLERLSPQVGTTLINANHHLEKYAQFGVDIISDLTSVSLGPLAGMQAGLAACETPYLLCAPCDSPFVPLDLAQRLSEALIAKNADIAIAICNEEIDGVSHISMQVVFCLMRADLWDHITAFINKGERRVRAWYATLNTVEVLFDESAAFRNFNTLAELNNVST